jgi:hypothetical protein
MEQDQFLFVAEFHWDTRKDGADTSMADNVQD